MTESEPAPLEVGRVVRPHGLKGQVVVELWTNRLERVAPGSTLIGPHGDLVVERAVPVAGSGGTDRYLVWFRDLADRAGAESLRDSVLRAEPLADESALWVHEMIGARVTAADGEVIGRVEAVESNPASDLLVLEDGRLIPLRFVTDQAPGRLTVDLPPGLLDL